MTIIANAFSSISSFFKQVKQSVTQATPETAVNISSPTITKIHMSDKKDLDIPTKFFNPSTQQWSINTLKNVLLAQNVKISQAGEEPFTDIDISKPKLDLASQRRLLAKGYELIDIKSFNP